MDIKRSNNENFGVEFSQKTWAALAEVWGASQGQMMTKGQNPLVWEGLTKKDEN